MINNSIYVRLARRLLLLGVLLVGFTYLKSPVSAHARTCQSDCFAQYNSCRLTCNGNPSCINDCEILYKDCLNSCHG